MGSIFLAPKKNQINGVGGDGMESWATKVCVLRVLLYEKILGLVFKGEVGVRGGVNVWGKG